MNNVANDRRGSDMTRLYLSASIIMVVLELYYYCHGSFHDWGLKSRITDRLFDVVSRTGLFNNFLFPKLAALVCLALSFMSADGRKDGVVNYKWPLIITLTGLIFYFGISYVVRPGEGDVDMAKVYMAVTGLGYMLILGGGARLSAAIGSSNHRRFFANDTGGFLQQEKRIDTVRSLNFRAKYWYNGKIRKSFINIINPCRGILLIGSPGCGKSRFIIEPAIKQLTNKGMALFVYDFKYPALTELTYHYYRQNADKYPSSGPLLLH